MPLRSLLLSGAVAVGVAVSAAGCVGSESRSHAGTPAATSGKPGDAAYQKHCAVCHGADGRGDGAAAYLLDPKPRNFRMGYFRLVSTANGVPTEDDLVRVIKAGMPGTPMPSWAQLGDAQIKELAQYVLSLRHDELVQEGLAKKMSQADAEAKAKKKTTPGDVIKNAPPAMKWTPEELKASFVEKCAPCHAEDGTGKDDPAWRTGEGYGIKSRNFKRGVFKGGREDLDLFRRITAGLPGTPMPGFGAVSAEDRWKMVKYIQTLSEPAAQQKAWVKETTVTAKRVASIPVDVNAPVWNDVPAVELGLLALKDNPLNVLGVTVRAARDDASVAFLLEWADDSRDANASRVVNFSDGAAVQLSGDADPPLFTMGDPDKAVQIWYWKAMWQPEATQQSAIDHYLDEKKGWVMAAPDEDTTFETGRAAGNSASVADRTGKAEEMHVTRFGSLTPAPMESQAVDSAATWANGKWRVLLRHPIKAAHQGDVAFAPNATLRVGVAVWNGAAGDRNGQKSASIWQNLKLEP